MADLFTKAKRSEVMSRIRGRGNRDTELTFLAMLRAQKITGWRRHIPISIAETNRSTDVDGPARRRSQSVRPDFVFRAQGLIVFVDGCFWHGCPEHAVRPKTNHAFWHRKLSANRSRDKLVDLRLAERGWKVLRVWEHELKDPESVHVRLKGYLKTKSRP